MIGMGRMVAIEGGDGAGKATAAANLVALAHAAGHTAALISFPRYRDTAAGHMLGEFLAGRLPQTLSPRAVAVLYALDRFESADALAALVAEHDLVVLDRYIASNIAYQAAKVSPVDAPAMIAWITRLEREQFGLPAPDLTLYLDTPMAVARELILRKRQRSYTDRSYDEHEADVALQARVREVYAALAEAGTLGCWHTVETVRAGTMRAPGDIAAEIGELVMPLIARGGG